MLVVSNPLNESMAKKALSKTPPRQLKHCQLLAKAAEDKSIELRALAVKGYPGVELSPKILPGLISVGYWNSPRDQNWGMTWHQHDGLELEFVESGQLDLGIGSEVFEQVRANHIAITRPWQRHRYGNPYIRSSRLHWLIIDLGANLPNQQLKWPSWVVLSQDDQKEFADLIRLTESSTLPVGAPVRKAILRIAQLVRNVNQESFYSSLAMAINEYLLALLKTMRKSDLHPNASLGASFRAVDLFLQSLRNSSDALKAPWTVRQMAKECGVSQTLYTNYCRQIVNKSPADYLKSVRVERACVLLLENPDLSVSDVAEQCGFATPAYFTTVFRQEKNVTPREYRQAGREI